MLSLILLSIGVVVIIFAFGQMGQIHEEKGVAIITNSPISPTERLPEELPTGMSQKACWSIFMLGLAMVIVGSGLTVWFRDGRD
jgi:hypothetical protein